MNDVIELKHIIDAQPVKGRADEVYSIYNPATGKIIRRVQAASADDVRLAIEVAHERSEAWRAVTPSKRAQMLFNYRQLIIQHTDELAQLISQEHGKTIDDAKGEIARGLEVVEFCTAINNHLKSDFTAEVSSGIDSYNLRQPLGVCAGITPFNFPAMVPMWMYPVAIACGNTFVLKLSEKTPSCGLRLTELMYEAGLPAGVLNTLVGGKAAVDVLLQHPLVKAISFVGSTPVGESIYREASHHHKRVQALCGAKNHLVVMPDADLTQACDAILGAAYGSAGERCMAVSVVITVGDETAEQLIEQLAPKVQQLRVGAYHEKDVEMGPVVSQDSKNRIVDYIEQGVAQGATLKIDGRDTSVGKGFFLGGSLFDHVQPTMSIYLDEIFGPVLSIVRVKEYADALALINTHAYGNGAAIFTRDGDAARHFSMHVEAGMVGVNVPIPVPVAMHSFGGWKRSLFGSAAIHGMEGVRFYTRLKTVTTRWPSGIRQGAQFNFQGGKDA
ncbi:CoA-acylating methylmalonate-semialdehyde dehydrogenase [Cardiobacteriales bacterium ML27]|uniref:methylmalonate-semialdehyde dehydrogenase (CoA acylating) n=2 Tax=Ostreibacterium oceani TaxID=2654998 RepID=A0A6N7ESP8_9GAMM|nr:CoA-acylating methylmalonate-semialdehyde dehydrogenase [Ostreibacterium oceani]